MFISPLKIHQNPATAPINSGPPNRSRQHLFGEVIDT